uniref:phosphatidylinositol-3,5-bisphosphate 3-phosphatase n=1 Tax=Latimeria chalumnae TaxID=7897 RepID=M3XKQ5_LATCH|nr:PREDICTED: myotubularin-related protein 4 isoform X2 [Latimeria chalumnae]|eukprot:XP_014341745.1 PREDICTED: myotubularin-related protein 4 isoform X2 [Latimeria chalumnae]
MSLSVRISCSMLNCFGEEGPPSLEYIQAKDLFPQKELVKEEESLQVPFPVLQGEWVEYLGRTENAVISISNYRLHVKLKDSVINVPLRLIESVESRDMFQLHIVCKDSKVVRSHFSTFKQCQEWLKRLNRAVAHPARLEDLFAFAYHAWCLGVCADEEDQHVHLCRPGDHVRHRFEMELLRMGFDLQNAWRVSEINKNYKLCSSYPQKLLVPVWITDKELENVGSFRSWKRIPVVVYRHQRNGAVIARCSQPEISWWGWRNTDDEYLVTSIAKACALNPGTRAASGSNAKGKSEGSNTSDTDFDSSLTACPSVENGGVPQKLLILDARSYTAAVANRAKGGGCECEEYYPNCEVMFMGMANIHSIRNSFQSLRGVCSQIPDPGNWLSALENTKWLQHLSVMLKAATLVSNAVDREGRPVLVHCSDGWDRTPQIVALAKILLDPYYRTIEGFQVLVESDWLDFGHKFGDRCGHQENSEDLNEQCPVFVQWLDCVHQLLKQFPCLFEFNEAFLVKLVQHTYSCLYGTFLCNNPCEREARNTYKRTCSVWSLLRTGNKNFQNFLYITGNETILHPVCHVRALQLWTAVYLPTSSPCTAAEDNMDLYHPPSNEEEELDARSLDRLPKTRSMDNLISACETGVPFTRTSSDPNLNKHCQEGRTSLEPRSGTGVAAGAEISEGPVSFSIEHNGVSGEEEEGNGSSSSPHPGVANQENATSDENSNSLKDYHLNLEAPTSPGSSSGICNGFNAKRNPSESQKREMRTVGKGPEGQERTCESVNVAKLPLQKRALKNGHMGKSALEYSGSSPAVDLLIMERKTKGTIVCSKNQDPERNSSIMSRPRAGAENSDVGKALLDSAWRCKKQTSPSQFSDFSMLDTNWDSMQGMAESTPVGEMEQKRALQLGCCNKRLNSKHFQLLRGLVNGQCPLKDSLKQSSHHYLSLSSVGSRIKDSRFPTLCQSKQLQLGRQLGMISSSSSSSSSSPSPPGCLDDDGLPFPVDVIQQRLRQIEAGYKHEVEQLRRQVRELQVRLESRQCCAPPSEPEVDYEDDFTCLKESDDSDEESSLSVQSDDRLSETSWESVEKKDTEVTRWVPDHMASHCFNCDSAFWFVKRRHHCRNCGNVFCAGCCFLKLPIPDQQLYDPVLVCNSCYDQIQVCRARELMSQQLKKPIATASS